ncbi:MAG: hypothetical protein AAGF89_16815 [Bacteroidota bacterium]
MLKSLLPIFLFSLVFLPGCKTDANKSTTEAAPSPTYPSIEVARIEFLANNATYMDATFYNLPISINQSELEQIRATLATISTEPIIVPAGAKPIAHIWFQVNGKNVEDADLYFQEDCVGYVWYEAGKPAYSNQLTKDGVMFYNNIIQSVPGQQ